MSKIILQDKIFTQPGKVKPFEFNSEVAEVFDDMIQRSVPLYHETQHQIHRLIENARIKPKRIYDLGTSTGNLIFFLASQIKQTHVEYVGIDASQSMIDKALFKQKTLKLKGKVHFYCEDILKFSYKKADVMVSNYVLQFLKPKQRLAFLRRCCKTLSHRGLFFLSEKTAPESEKINKLFIACHEEFKKQNQYSDLEIAQKRKALENVLVPFSLEKNIQQLKQAGFKHAEPFFVWHNFSGIVAIK